MSKLEVTKSLADECTAAVQTEMQTAMDRLGLTSEYLGKKLKQELNAKKILFFQKDGEVVSERIVKDMGVRQKARMDAHKLRGDYPAEKHEHSGPGGGPIEHMHELYKALDERVRELTSEHNIQA